MGANVNTDTLLTSRSPLMIALFHNNLQILNLLVDKGANIYAKDCNMLTGLHYAVDSNILQNVKFCQNHGFDLNARDNKGWTPLIRSGTLLYLKTLLITQFFKLIKHKMNFYVYFSNFGMFK